MKPRQRAKKPAVSAPRIFNLHARFTPEGPEQMDSSAFLGFCFISFNQINKFKNKKLAEKKTEFAKFRNATKKTFPILFKILRDEISPELAAQKVKRLVPDK